MRLIIAFIFAIALAACSGEAGSFIDIPQSGWAYGDTCRLTAPAGGTMNVVLRHDNSYPYSNIWLEVAYLTTDSTSHRDTLNIELCDVYGRWYGSGVGTLFQIEQELPAGDILSGSDVAIRHVMRVDTLRGVEKLGVMP